MEMSTMGKVLVTAKLINLEDLYGALSDMRNEMADHGRFWTYQPELVEQDIRVEQEMREIRARIERLKAGE